MMAIFEFWTQNVSVLVLMFTDSTHAKYLRGGGELIKLEYDIFHDFYESQ